VDQIRQLAERLIDLKRQPRRGRRRRSGALGGDQGLDPGRGPDRRLAGKRVEAALDYRQGAIIGVADLRRRVESPLLPAVAAGQPLDQPQRLVQLRDLAARIDAGRRRRRWRLVRHGAGT
jgi:hypothetical protein